MLTLPKHGKGRPAPARTHSAMKWLLTLASGLLTSGLVVLLNDQL